MPRRVALLLIAVALAPGCAQRAPPVVTPPASEYDLALVEAGSPTLSGPRIAWNFSARWTLDEDSGPLNVTLRVVKYPQLQLPPQSQDHSFPPQGAKTLRYETPFLGPGDYYYELNATEPDGGIAGLLTGFFETCLLHASAQQC